MQTRPAQFAGSWYPANSDKCQKTIEALYKPPALSSLKNAPVGGIVPHAGWYFSGQLACRVFQQLAETDSPDLIVILGGHLSSHDPGRIMTHGAWETPLGLLPVAEDFTAAVKGQFDLIIDQPTTAPPDNTIELQLPFIRYFWGAIPIVPIRLPPTPLAIEIGQTVAVIARESNTTIQVIGSTDLTHYGPNYGFTPQGTGLRAVEWVRQHNDQGMIEAVLAMNPQAVLTEASANQNSCCAGAVAGAIAAVRELGATTTETLDYTTSYDKHPGDSFVGYLAALFQ